MGLTPSSFPSLTCLLLLSCPCAAFPGEIQQLHLRVLPHPPQRDFLAQGPPGDLPERGSPSDVQVLWSCSLGSSTFLCSGEAVLGTDANLVAECLFFPRPVQACLRHLSWARGRLAWWRKKSYCFPTSYPGFARGAGVGVS